MDSLDPHDKTPLTQAELHHSRVGLPSASRPMLSTYSLWKVTLLNKNPAFSKRELGVFRCDNALSLKNFIEATLSRGESRSWTVEVEPVNIVLTVNPSDADSAANLVSLQQSIEFIQAQLRRTQDQYDRKRKDLGIFW